MTCERVQRGNCDQIVGSLTVALTLGRGASGHRGTRDGVDRRHLPHALWAERRQCLGVRHRQAHQHHRVTEVSRVIK